MKFAVFPICAPDIIFGVTFMAESSASIYLYDGILLLWPRFPERKQLNADTSPVHLAYDHVTPSHPLGVPVPGEGGVFAGTEEVAKLALSSYFRAAFEL